MKIAVRMCIVAMLSLLGVSCASDKDMITLKHRNDTGDWKGERQDGGNALNGKDTVVYVTAVEFPDDYFWQRDSVGEGRKFKLCLYADGKKVLSLNGGPGSEISADPDMHRVIDGHLYSEWSGNSYTVILEDGKPLLRYEGREMICGFLKKEGLIYTLGQSRNGKGITLRQNGNVIFEDAEGIAIGEMSNPCSESGGLYTVDSGDIVFFYQIPEKSAMKQKARIFKVCNGVPEELELNQEIDKVHDVRIIDGEMYVACCKNDKGKTPVVYYGEKTVSWEVSSNVAISNFRLRWAPGGKVFVRMDYTWDGWRSAASSFLGMNGEKVDAIGHCIVYDYYLSGDSYAYVTESVNGRILTCFTRDDESEFKYESGDNCCFMSSLCATISGDRFYAGISSLERFKPPVLLINDKAKELKINGYISGVKVVAGN